MILSLCRTQCINTQGACRNTQWPLIIIITNWPPRLGHTPFSQAPPPTHAHILATWLSPLAQTFLVLICMFPFKMVTFILFFLNIYFYLFDCARLVRACGIWFPDQGLNPCVLQWEHGILATGPPWKRVIIPSFGKNVEKVGLSNLAVGSIPCMLSLTLSVRAEHRTLGTQHPTGKGTGSARKVLYPLRFCDWARELNWHGHINRTKTYSFI